jgi:hypothetical protein
MAKLSNVSALNSMGSLVNATKTLEMLYKAFGEHSLSQTAVSEWHSRFKAGPVSTEDDERSGRPNTTIKTKKDVKKFDNSSTKSIAEQSMSSQTPLGSVMKFARRS